MTATNEIAAASTGALALDPTQTEWTENQRAALTQLGIANAPKGDQLVFLHYAQKTGLDPFARQIFMIKRWDSQSRSEKFTIQAGIDGLRVIAERTGRYEGRTPISWCGADGVWRDVWLDKSTPPTAARVGVYKDRFREPLVAVAVFEEYAARKKDKDLTHMWASKPAHMIGKVAEALALRAAFPQDLSNVFTPEETDRDAPQGEPGVGEAGESIATATAAQTDMYAPTSEQMITAAQKSEIAGRVRDLKLDRESGLELYAEATGREVPTTNLLTAVEAEKVLERLAAWANPGGPEIADAEVVDEDEATFEEYAGGAA